MTPYYQLQEMCESGWEMLTFDAACDYHPVLFCTLSDAKEYLLMEDTNKQIRIIKITHEVIE